MRSKLILAVAASCLFAMPAHARDQIRVVGSSTVFPFITAAAEQFGQAGNKTPIVESTGTGGGIKLFCEGADDATPDIANASRAMMDSEKELCKKNGVAAITELAIGYDGIVVAADKKSPALNLTRKDIFLALARQVPKDGKLVANTYAKWNEVNPALAAEPIEVYGPPPTSGTRDAFVELAMEAACIDMPEYVAAYADKKERAKACHAIREDGKYIDSGEDDNVIVQKLKSNPHAIGVFGYSYFIENSSALQAMKVDGVTPAMAEISNGSYKLSRKLYIYVKNDHLSKIPALPAFVKEIASPAAMGADGYMAAKGMIPLHTSELEAVRKQAAALK